MSVRECVRGEEKSNVRWMCGREKKVHVFSVVSKKSREGREKRKRSRDRSNLFFATGGTGRTKKKRSFLRNLFAGQFLWEMVSSTGVLGWLGERQPGDEIRLQIKTQIRNYCAGRMRNFLPSPPPHFRCKAGRRLLPRRLQAVVRNHYCSRVMETRAACLWMDTFLYSWPRCRPVIYYHMGMKVNNRCRYV